MNRDVVEEQRKGSLQILSHQDAFLRTGTFDTSAMLDFLAKAEASSLSNGYTGLR